MAWHANAAKATHVRRGKTSEHAELPLQAWKIYRDLTSHPGKCAPNEEFQEMTANYLNTFKPATGGPSPAGKSARLTFDKRRTHPLGPFNCSTQGCFA